MPELVSPPVIAAKRLLGLSPLAERGVDIIVATLTPPPDWPGLPVVLANTARVLRRLVSREGPVGALAAEHAELFRAAASACPACSAAEAAALLAGRRTASPAWTWLATAPADVPASIQELAAAELLLSTIEQRPFRHTVASRLAELDLQARDASQRGVVHARAAGFTSKLLADIRELAPQVGTFSQADRAVRARILAHLHQQLNAPNPDERKACGSVRELTPTEAAEYAGRLKTGVSNGDVNCLLEVLGHCMGMSIDTVALVPFAAVAPTNWVARIDPQSGIGQVDLGPLLALAASKPGHEEAAPVVPVYFPAFAAAFLRTLAATCPDARKLGDLLDKSARRPRPRGGAGKGATGNASSARFVRSRASVAITAGADRSVAAVATLDLTKLGKPTLHYITMKPDEVWNAQEIHFGALGWGEPVELDTGALLAVGSRATPKEEVVKDVEQALVRRVEQTRPGRKYTLSSIENFHNNFALLCCHRAQFFTAARRAENFEFYADWFTASRDTAILVDKRVGPHLGATPLPIPVRLARQTQYWAFHLQALSARLEKISVREHRQVIARVQAVITGQHVRMFFLIKEGQLQELGNEDLQKLHPELALNGDAWRHFIANALRRRGVPSEMVSCQLRHYLQGHDHSEYAATIPQARWIGRLAQELDLIALDLGMDAVPGLRRTKKGGN